MNKVIVYCDGGCRGNQNKENIGGWGVVLTQGQHHKTLKGYDYNTTNNKMELTSAIKALETIKRTDIPIEIYMDSAYVVTGINEWVNGWIRKNWRKKDKKPVENKELWQKLHELKSKFAFISFIKVKGHVGIELNELADQLANLAMDEAEEELH